jgi:hypothetical protein
MALAKMEYYQLAHNLHALNRLRWVMESSLLCTLARKHRSSVVKQRQRYRTRLQTAHGPRQGLQVVVVRDKGKKPLVATWGGIALQRRQHMAAMRHRTRYVGNLCQSCRSVRTHAAWMLLSL